MPGISADLSISLKARQSGSNDFGGPDFSLNMSKAYQFVNGTLSDQVDILFADERSFAASTADPIDLAGVLLSALGSVITAVEIVGIIIINESRAGVRNTVTLTVGAGSNPWFGLFGATGNTVKVPPGGTVLMVAPDANGYGAVTPGTGDILTITPGAATGTYQIAILGRTA